MAAHYIDVTISVTDEDEPPSAPATPTVTATADTGRSLEVTWNEPTNTGPPINRYEIAYRKYRQGSNSDEYQVLAAHRHGEEGHDNDDSGCQSRNAPGASHPVRGARAGNERGGGYTSG